MSRPHKTVTVQRLDPPKKEFTAVRNALLDDKAVPPAARFVLIWLLRHDDQFHTSVARVAKGVGINRETAEKYCVLLEEAGYLDRSGTAWKVTDVRGALAGKSSNPSKVTQVTSNEDAGKPSIVRPENPATKKNKEHQVEDQPPTAGWPVKKTKVSPAPIGDTRGKSGTAGVDEDAKREAFAAKLEAALARGDLEEAQVCRGCERSRWLHFLRDNCSTVTDSIPIPSVPDVRPADDSASAHTEGARLVLLSPCDNHKDKTGRVDNRSGARLCEKCAPYLWDVA